eukprot:scaffold139706_cov42-Attheya_sp.AAC.2
MCMFRIQIISLRDTVPRTAAKLAEIADPAEAHVRDENHRIIISEEEEEEEGSQRQKYPSIAL